jgi:hypothetical protein
MSAQLFPGPLIVTLQGVLLIIFRKKISIFLEKAYEKVPTNKISRQFYKISYKVSPIYIAILGVVFIMISFLMLFQ